MGYLRSGLCGFGLLLASTVGAQTLPAPAEFYFDDDTRTASPVVAIAGDDDQTHARLMQLIDRNARNADQARAQLAQALMRRGREDTGRAMYAQAFGALPARSPQRSTVHWNYGWDLYRRGHHQEALDQWRQALEGRLVRPSWAPPTLALALWSNDRRDEAVRWYAAAVRTEPALWSDPARYPALLPDWTAAERATLAEVFAAWQSAPPAWP
ncbi:tetratricopeptide repeat protein [Luteimonas sp. 3794]|uniref:tetratricopeptide repeat protein n=1 Tax=Luteimonas sp. 3794 TaxID=2817730 RepID=UPI0028633BA2|nr:tetratricopeptide repeat protein [Luteimonas sp. 3794]MDR6989982.1 tetratricopeptide (TPR) repeat protein [Luteimonas sp. 3794]